MKKICMAILVLIFVTGCSQINHRQGFIIGGQGIESKPTYVAKEEKSVFFVNGIGQAKEIDAAAICGGTSKVGYVEKNTRFSSGFLRVITFGLYAPVDYKVTCFK